MSSMQKGFTLVEMIAVIVILSIVAISSIAFIRFGVQNYTDSTRRYELSQQGRFAIERISREVRTALPNSVRRGEATVAGVKYDCLEFMPIAAAGSYLGAVSEAAIPDFEAVDFPFPSGAVSGYAVAIYPHDPSDIYASSTYISAIDLVSAAASNKRTVSLAVNTQFAEESPQKRFFIVSDRVSFCALDGRIVRYSGYSTASVAQPIPPSGTASLVAENIRLVDRSGAAIRVFDVTSGTLYRAGIVHIDLQFQDSREPSEWVQFSQEVFLRTTP